MPISEDPLKLGVTEGCVSGACGLFTRETKLPNPEDDTDLLSVWSVFTDDVRAVIPVPKRGLVPGCSVLVEEAADINPDPNKGFPSDWSVFEAEGRPVPNSGLLPD